jgi:3-hydroxy acid dehydrogenase/malonic semialdehyde reductase
MSKHNSSNPVVLVSGASSGIGEAVCRLLVAQQFRVVAAARNQERLQQLAAQLGDALYPLVLDVTDAAA